MRERIRNFFEAAWRASRPLTFTFFFMVADAVVCAIGLATDHRVLTGATIWAKPMQFAVSSGLFAITMAIAFGSLERRLLRAWAGRALAGALMLEITLIDLQAARGVMSHFNFSTSFNGAVFGAMAIGISVLLMAMLAVTIGFFRQKTKTGGWVYAWRWAVLLTTLGAASAGFMTQPTAEQMRGFHAGAREEVVGGHTVGAPDGGPGLPLVNWSTEHGDIRVAHFLGLHALQMIPLWAWVVSRRRFGRGQGDRLVLAGALSYGALMALLLWQALRGQSVARPDAVTLLTGAAWLVLTAGAMWAVAGRARRGATRNGVGAEAAR